MLRQTLQNLHHNTRSSYLLRLKPQNMISYTYSSHTIASTGLKRAPSLALRSSPLLRCSPLSRDWRQTHKFAKHDRYNSRIHPGFNNFNRTFAAASTTETVDISQEKDSSSSSSAVPIILTVNNMKCGGCSAAVKRILLQQPHISGAAVNLLTETAVVQVNTDGDDTVQPESAAEAAAAALSSKGFPSTLRVTDEESLAATAAARDEQKKKDLQSSTRTLAFAWTLAIACYGHHIGHFLHAFGLHEYAHTGFMMWLGNPVVSGVLGAAAIFGPGRKLLVDGAASLVRGTPNMNSLIAMGASTSFMAGILSAVVPGLSIDASFLEEPVMLLAFVLLGRSLEERARANASMDLTTLAQLIPSSSRLLLDPGVNPSKNAVSESAEEVVVPTSTVKTGDILRVLPGERIPVDATVVSGTCCVDESMLTGESNLVVMKPGDKVTGGTVTYEAPIVIQATSTGSSSTLAGIGRMVTEAQSREAPVQRLADTVAGWFCYGVMTASAATFGFWYLLGSDWFPQALDVVDDSTGSGALLLAIKLAIDVLVVACPCALGLATPTAVLVATSAGAKRGLLIRGGDVLERLAQVTDVVFDKTGTLTEGKLRVHAIDTFSRSDRSDVLQLAAAVESMTTHPLATAIRQTAIEENLEIPTANSSYTVPGEGVYGSVNGRDVYVGRLAWVQQQIGATQQSLQTESSSAGSTTVWVGSSDAGVIARIEFMDSLRTETEEVIRSLYAANKRIIVLSGDEESVARAVALEAGINANDVYGRVKPEEKASFVTNLRSNGACVAMVGDGVNDAIALSAADVGIAMGGGTDAAGAASSVVLMGDRLGQVLEALNIGEATLNKIRQNLVLAMIYNVVGIPIAAGALLPEFGIALSPTVAAGMMSCSSITVVLNSISLRSYNPSK